jgi:hypothetical protein
MIRRPQHDLGHVSVLTVTTADTEGVGRDCRLYDDDRRLAGRLRMVRERNRPVLHERGFGRAGSGQAPP